MDRLYSKKPGGTLYGRYYDDRGKRQLVCLKTRDRRVGEQRLRQIERGLAPARAADAAEDQVEAQGGLTLEAVLARFLAHVERRVEIGQRSAETQKMYRIKAGHLIRLLGATTDVHGFDGRTEEQFVDARQDEGASDHTIHKELITLRAALKRAKKDGLFRTDLDSLRSEHSPNYEPRRTVLTPGQYARLLGAMRPERAATFAFIVLTAARDTEWQRVEHGDVHFEGDLLLRGSKTERSWRQLPLKEHADLRALLTSVMADLPRDPSQRLFAPWSNIRRDLHQACERVRQAHDDPTFPNVSPNDLRRTFATWCIQAGMPTTRVAMLLGHRDARMVERVYGVLDSRTIGRDLAKVFDDLDLPAVPPAPPARGYQMGIKPRSSQGTHEKQETRASTASPTGTAATSVPRDGIEPPTRGFSVPPSDGGNVGRVARFLAILTDE